MNDRITGPGTDRGHSNSCSLLNPVGLLTGPAARASVSDGTAKSLAGGPVAFTQCEIIDVSNSGDIAVSVMPVQEMPLDLSALTDPRPAFAGHELSRPLIMGVVNVTPDSFSDGGDHADPMAAIGYARALLDAGADILDIGGESTRPGAATVSVTEECDRILPVIAATVASGATVSVDSMHAATMRAAIDAGATIVNDITALTGDPESVQVISETGASVILMHMQGTPEIMQDRPNYRLASFDIFRFLEQRVGFCEAANIPRQRIAVDPGVGFGKTDTHNMEILDRAAAFHGLGCAVAIGVSRKSFIGRLAGVEEPKDRLPGTLAATSIAASRGIQIHRVHDVAAARQAFTVWNAQNDNG